MATPSKKVRVFSTCSRRVELCIDTVLQAAAAFEKFSLESPVKKMPKLEFIDDRERSTSPQTEETEQQSNAEEVDSELEYLRSQYVGEVDLPESK